VPTDAAALDRRIEAGYRFIACGLDTLFIMQGCGQMLAARRNLGEGQNR
jgi:hypothetical protein